MDLNNQQLLKRQKNNYIGKEEDRISELPDSLLHRILSRISKTSRLFFLDTKCVARTSVLSKRWGHVWTSFPILDFSGDILLSETTKFMEFVDRTFLLHDMSSNIQKFLLQTNVHMSASRVHSWIEYLTRRNVQQLDLWLEGKPFYVPFSLFTCESLIRLELSASVNCTTHLPKSFSFPKLKSLALCGIQFTDDDSWNEQHFSNCPVLENLILVDCTWIGVRYFCISTPTLKLLKIDDNGIWDADGLPDCALKIHAPNLVSLTYCGNVPKEYVLCSFQTLESARVLLERYDEPISEEKIGYYGAAVSKLFQALSHVQSLTIESLEDLSTVDDFVNILPTFHNLDELFLKEVEETTDKSVFALLKAAPNLSRLVFVNRIHDNEEEEDIWDGLALKEGCLFQHLQSVSFVYFNGKTREMRWLKLLLKNAKALQTVTIGCYSKSMDAETREFLMSELPSLPKASHGCVIKFH